MAVRRTFGASGVLEEAKEDGWSSSSSSSSLAPGKKGGGRRKKNFLEDIGPAHTQEKEEKKIFCVCDIQGKSARP